MRRSQIVVYIHAVWGTWDRLPLITEEVERPIHRSIGAKCQELGAEVVAIGGVADHPHTLIVLPATITIADLIGQIKGASAHLVTHDIRTDGRFFKWQGAYGAFSVSPDRVDAICHSIANQKQHHQHNTLVAEWEWTDDDALKPDRT